MTYAVEFNDVSRLYGDVRAVDGVSIAIRDGVFLHAGAVGLRRAPACG
ncbi:hypothetical protein KIF59_03245 [Enterobacter cloacae subsp. cloacae]|nr:hypothetical protein [Enterobacter cloacae subsp. cloacae]